MKTILIQSVACLACLAAPLRADEPANEQVKKRVEAALKTAQRQGIPAAAVEARRKQIAELEAQVEEAEKKNFDEMSAVEHLKLAEAYSQLRRVDDAVKHADAALAAAPDLPACYSTALSAQLAAGNTERGEELLKTYAEKFPDHANNLPGMHRELAMAYLRARNSEKGLEHMIAALDQVAASLQREPSNETLNSAEVRRLVTICESLNQNELALEKLEKYVAALQSALPKRPELGSALSEIQSLRIKHLAKAGKNDEAQKLLNAELEAARKALDAEPDSAERAVAVAMMLQARTSITPPGDTQTVEAVENEMRQFVTEQFQRHPEAPQLVQAWTEVVIQRIQGLIRAGQLDEATSELTSAKETIAKIHEAKPGAAAAMASTQNVLRSLEQTLERQRVHGMLIGQSAFPLEGIDGWINGSPLTTEELKGKVVLLDFWAVWCGPCIATFPHLRDWNTRFANEGLVIIGLTKYYRYGWDAESGRAKREEEITPENERQAVTQFAEHHELKHRLALMAEDCRLSKEYGVSGIPQAVLIDRNGVIQLIRVGSGEANAHDLEAKIQELLAKPVSAAGN